MAEAEVWPVNENAVHNNNNNNVEEDEWGAPGTREEDEEPKRIHRVKKHMAEPENSEGRVKSAEGKEPRRGNKEDSAEWMNDNDEPSSGRRERPDKGADRDRAERRDRTTHDRDRGDGRRDDRNQMDRRDRGDGRRDRGEPKSREYGDRGDSRNDRYRKDNSRGNSRRGSRDRGDSGHQGRDRGHRGDRRGERDHYKGDREDRGGRFYSPRNQEGRDGERRNRYNDRRDDDRDERPRDREPRDRGDYGGRDRRGSRDHGDRRGSRDHGDRRGSRDHGDRRDRRGYDDYDNNRRGDRARPRDFDDDRGDRRPRYDRPREDRRRRDDDDRGDRRSSRRGSRSGHDDRVDDRPKRIQYIPPSLTSDKDVETSQFSQKGKNFGKYVDTEVSCTGPGSESVNFIQDFKKSELNGTLLTRLKSLDFQTPTPVQRASIPAIMLNRDIMACAQTGSGKTAAYLLPILDDLMNQNIKAESADRQFPQVLIVTPTRELAIQIYEQCRMFAKGTRLMAQCLYGGTDVRFVRTKISENGCNILIGTPGRINDFLERDLLGLNRIQYFVLDEADRMLDMGFGPIMKLLATGYRMPRPGKRQTLMFSATFPQTIQQFAADFMDSEYLFIKVGVVGGACADVSQEVILIGTEESKKSGKLEELIKEVAHTRQRTLVFVETKVKADFIACMLSQTNVPTTSIHGGRLQPEREAALSDFRSGACPILVATSVAARGLDIPEVEHVINYELPREIEEYVHRIGRTGRCGNLGKSTSFYDTERDCHIAGALVKVLGDATQPVPDWLVEEAERAKSSTDSYRNRQFNDSNDLRQNPGYVQPPRREYPDDNDNDMRQSDKRDRNYDRGPDRRREDFDRRERRPDRRDRGPDNRDRRDGGAGSRDRRDRGFDGQERGPDRFERAPKDDRSPPNTERSERQPSRPANDASPPGRSPEAAAKPERKARPERAVPSAETKKEDSDDEWGV